MKAIAINGRFLTQPTTGVQRYAREVTLAMDRMLAEGRLPAADRPVEILVPPGTATEQGYSACRVRECGWGSGQLWEQLSLPWCCRGRVLFTPSGGSPLLHGANVFMLPDIGVLATPAAYRPAYRLWYSTHHRLAVRSRGLRLLTVSRFSQAEIAKFLRVPADRITVTLPGHEHVFAAAADTEILKRLGLAPGTFVLGVGSANPNKNFAGLLRAFARFRESPLTSGIRLVVAGGANPAIFGESGSLPDYVVQAGYVSDGELRALYEAAAVFCFPSFYEGFGLPPLEAMALGCPVVCSDAASLPEVCGVAAELASPGDRDAMAAALGTAIGAGGAEAREQRAAAGLIQSAKFRWEDTARPTWLALTEAASAT